MLSIPMMPFTGQNGGIQDRQWAQEPSQHLHRATLNATRRSSLAYQGYRPTEASA